MANDKKVQGVVAKLRKKLAELPLKHRDDMTKLLTQLGSAAGLYAQEDEVQGDPWVTRPPKPGPKPKPKPKKQAK